MGGCPGPGMEDIDLDGRSTGTSAGDDHVLFLDYYGFYTGAFLLSKFINAYT